jgi:plasmid stabilization system protein ParE
MENRKIRWDKQAFRQFNKAILYIAEDSIQNAENIRIDIIDKLEVLIIHPERHPHPVNKYKQNNDGNYRVFELHLLRVTYFIGSDFIRILRVRHIFL